MKYQVIRKLYHAGQDFQPGQSVEFSKDDERLVQLLIVQGVIKSEPEAEPEPKEPKSNGKKVATDAA